MKNKYELWLGDETSLNTYLMVLEKSLEPDLLVGSRAVVQQDTSPLITLYDSVAVISIQGALLPYSNWMTQMMGLVGYPDIREALVQASQLTSVDQIVLDIGSPGGAASGIEDISQLIKQIREVMPVTAYTNSTMASAAYWIGVSADKVYSSRTASVGSIGVVATHIEYTKALAADGIKATVFRAGEFKALGGPYEVLSEKATTVIQSRMDALYQEFINHVAESRGVSAALVHSKMADGREFLGYEALQAGLIDGNMSIDELMSTLMVQPQSGSTPKPAGRINNTRMEASDAMKKKLLTPQIVAQIEAGGDAQAILAAAPDAPNAPETQTILAPEVPTSLEAPAEVEPPVVVAVDSEMTAFLKAELSAATEKLMTATMQARDLQTKLDSMTTNHESMRGIVIDATNVKRIALGGHATDLSTCTDEGLLQQYQQANTEYRSHFPIGGVAELPSTEQHVAVEPTPLDRSRIKAVKFS